MSTLLEVTNLKKYFPIKKGVFSKTAGQLKAVDDVSFSLQKGEVLGIVGESGSGKSTVAKLILMLLKATGGAVKFDGEVLFDKEANYAISGADLLAIRKHIQVVFQDPYASLDPRMTAFQIISEGLKKHEHISTEQRLNRSKELLEICGLKETDLYKYPHQFSGGQRQRIAIARALSLKPKLIICDEPTAALDVSIQSQILNLMLNLKRDHGLSYLFISHDLTVVRHFCDRICVMQKGKIVEENKSEALFENPKQDYTIKLLSAALPFDY